MMKKLVICMVTGLLLTAMPMSAQKKSVKVPHDAVLVDQTDTKELYTWENRAATTERPAIMSVWVRDKKNKSDHCLLMSNPSAETKWSQLGQDQRVAITYSDVVAIDKACFLRGSDLVYIEGCADARNVCSYIYDDNKQTGWQLMANEGLLYIDAEKKQIHLSSYKYYPEGGRYSVERIFGYDGTFVKEIPIGQH